MLKQESCPDYLTSPSILSPLLATTESVESPLTAYPA